jgi:hypothetical protein
VWPSEKGELRRIKAHFEREVISDWREKYMTMSFKIHTLHLSLSRPLKQRRIRSVGILARIGENNN